MAKRFLTLTVSAVIVLMALGLMIGCDDDDDGGTSGPSGTPINGDLTGTLGTGGSPYLLNGDAVVPDGQSLTIEPGVIIRAIDGYSITVNGLLDARGTEDALIRFTSAESPKQKGDWGGIYFVEADGNSVMEYCWVSYANKYDIVDDTTRAYDDLGNPSIDRVLYRGAITAYNCSPTISRCIVDNAGYDGIHIVGDASPVVQFNTLALNAFNGMRIEPDWLVDQSVYGYPMIHNNIIVQNEDAGIRAPSLYDAYMDNAWIGDNFSYNDIYNNKSPNYLPLKLGELVSNDVHLDPMFVDISNEDYTLHPCSGALDKGTPVASYSTDPDGTLPDMGVFPHYQAENELAHTLIGDRLHLTTDFEYYLVTCDVEVAEGTTLTIDPGVTILFAEPFSFVIKGEIQASGTASQPILFSSYSEEPTRLDWNNILFDGASNNSVMEHVIVEYASVDDVAEPYYIGAISIAGCSPTLRNIEVRMCYNTAIFCDDGASPLLENININNVGMYGIYCAKNSGPHIQGVEISTVQGYGIYCWRNSSPQINNVLIHNVNVSGIVLEQACSPTISNVTVYQPYNNGIRIKGNSMPIVTNSIFAEYGEYGAKAEISSLGSFDYVCLYSATGEETVGNISLANLFEADPRFTDPENGDFHLTSSSPLKNAGSDGTDIGAFGGSFSW